MKNANTYYGFYSTFPERLRGLIDEKAITQNELAQAIGTTRQAVAQYKDGKTQPTVEIITKIAKYFNVSADYLLGLTDYETTDTTLKGVCEYTGLDEESLSLLTKLLSYQVGDCIYYPAENGRELISQVTCKYDTPTYIINLLLHKPEIIGLIQSYLCILNDENPTSYQGDKGSAILFELMLKLRELRDIFQPIYKTEFYNYYKKDGVKDGDGK